MGVPGLTVKVNCVPTEANRDQLVPLAALAKDRDLSVRFIEMMPIGLGRNLGRLTQEEVLAQLTDAFGAPLDCPPPPGAGPSTYRTFPGFTGRVGFISAVSHQFCHNCNRVRLTATGYLKTCLQYETGRDLKAARRMTSCARSSQRPSGRNRPATIFPPPPSPATRP